MRKQGSVLEGKVMRDRARFSLYLTALSAFVITAPSDAQPTAAWTVLVYMNGVNNLEPFSLTNFQQMAKVGSSQSVNILTEFGRLGAYNSAPNSPQWSGVLRFRVTKDLVPQPSTAIANLGTADMGSPQTLRDFVVWGVRNYPAQHYALVIWNHGQGYRAYVRAAALVTSNSPTQSPYRSISTDDLHHTKLYMRDVEDVLHESLVSAGAPGAKLDIIGFDACLMAMVENAYALRNDGKYMIGSEELEPGLGWRYDDWLSRLVNNPSSDGQALGKMIVDSYAAAYGDMASPSADPQTTMSLANLGNAGDQAGDLANSVNAFADALQHALPNNIAKIRLARKACPEYAPNPFGDGHNYFFHIDLGCFANNIKSAAISSQVSKTADSVLASIRAEIIDNYVGTARRQFGSTGLAIYFPAGKGEYLSDQYAENGYEKTNTDHPVEFVQNGKWADFLHQYFTLVA